jgi:PAS domain S-box-containing protein
MKKNRKTSAGSTGLRLQAEERLRAKKSSHGPEAYGPRSSKDTQRLTHELQVHQIELQMQNEELLRARREVEAALERYTDLYDFAPVGYFTLDRDGAIRQVNLTGARLLGKDRSELGLRHFGAFVSRGDFPAFSAFLGKVFESRAKESCELSLRKEKEGDDLPWHRLVARIEATVTDDGKECRAVVMDITERWRAEEEKRRLEAKMQQAQKLESLGILAGGIAHDFNNLLMGVLGNVELILLELPPRSFQRKYLTNIKTAAARMAEIAKQMLDYTGKGSYLAAPLNLSDLVAEMASLLEVSLPKKVALKLDLTPGLPVIKADSNQIRQIVLNLVINAAEAIENQPGLVTIHTGFLEAHQVDLSQLQWHDELPEGPYAYLEVSDTGCGMTQDVLERIFDPFFTTKFTGRGLGLAALQGIIRSHRGAIGVHSEPAKGSTFRILFPRADQAMPAVSKAAQAPLYHGAEQTVLIVDDEEAVRVVTARLLEKDGYLILTARDGEEALRVISARPEDIDVVLLDLSMPMMDGVETFGKIREICPDLPIILSSAYNEKEATRAFAGKGLSGFIQKPYQIDALLRKLQEVSVGSKRCSSPKEIQQKQPSITETQ